MSKIISHTSIHTVDVRNHKTAIEYVNSFSGVTLPIEEVIERIIKLNEGLNKFWENPHGWAPIDAANLLTKSRLDWQVSLSYCLRYWIKRPDNEMLDGHIILGWANLGSLVEGTMKLFLSVYYKDYSKDLDSIKRKGEIQSPDLLMLEQIRQFFKKKIWDENWDNLVSYIQDKRNAIHAFKDKEIGSISELEDGIRKYLDLLRYINFRLPYPDDIYEPKEI